MRILVAAALLACLAGSGAARAQSSSELEACVSQHISDLRGGLRTEIQQVHAAHPDATPQEIEADLGAWLEPHHVRQGDVAAAARAACAPAAH